MYNESGSDLVVGSDRVVVKIAPAVTIIELQDGSQHELASRGRRLGARLIDMVLLTVAYLIAVFLLASTIISLEKSDALYGVGLFFILVACFFYEPTLISTIGQTLGKRMVNIRVVGVESGDVPGWGKGLKRWITPSLFSLIPFLGIIGYLALLWTPSRQTWYDKIAKTVVIKAPKPPRQW